MGVAEDVGLVREVWGAARDNDVDTLVGLTAADVDWHPTAVVSGALHGHEALRGYLADLATAGTLVDAYPYSFEAVGDCVIVSGALSLRGPWQRADRSALVGLPRGARESGVRRQPHEARRRLPRRADPAPGQPRLHGPRDAALDSRVGCRAPAAGPTARRTSSAVSQSCYKLARSASLRAAAGGYVPLPPRADAPTRRTRAVEASRARPSTMSEAQPLESDADDRPSGEAGDARRLAPSRARRRRGHCAIRRGGRFTGVGIGNVDVAGLGNR